MEFKVAAKSTGKAVSDLTITILFLMLPGIVAATICDKITIHSQWTSFKFGIYTFLLGVACYSLVQIGQAVKDVITHWVFGGPLQWQQLCVWNALANKGACIAPWEIIFSVAASLPIALFASWLINYKILNRIATKVISATKYGDENLFSYYLNARDVDWVYIRDMPNGITYQGRVSSYSENSYMQEIVLCDVSVFRYEDSEHMYDVPSIYLTKKFGELIIESISLDNLEKKDDGQKTVEGRLQARGGNGRGEETDYERT